MKKMRNILSLALVVLMLVGACASLSVTAATNLIINGGFEEGATKGGWTARGGISTAVSAAYTHEGGSSLAMTRLDNESSPVLDRWIDRMQNGKTYAVSVWLYVPTALSGTGTTNGAYVQMVTPAIDKQYVTTVGDWANVTFAFTWNGGDGGSAQFRIGMDATVSANSVIYVDDVQVTEITLKSFDGSMEDLSAWTASSAVALETDIVQNGENSLKIAGIGDAAQIVSISTSSHILAGCVKTGEGYTNEDGEINVYDGVGTNNLIFSKKIPVSSAWTKVEIEAIASDTGIVTIEFVNNGAGTVWFDNFTLKIFDNLITHPGFETGKNATATTGTVSDAYANTGSKSLEMSITGNNSSRYITVQNLIPCLPSTEYKFSFWYFSTTQQKPTAYIYKVDDTGREVGSEASISAANMQYSNGTWKKAETTFTTDAETNYLKVQFASGNADVSKLYFDDLVLVKADASESDFETAEGTSVCELTGGAHTLTAKLAVEADEAGPCLYVIAGYKIDKATRVRTLDTIKLIDKDLTVGTNQLTETIDITVADTDTYRYELKSYVLDMQNSKLAPVGKYNNIRSN